MIKTVFQNKKKPKSERLVDRPMVRSKARNAMLEQVENTELKMGMWHQFKFDRKTSELTSQKLGEIVVTMVEKQRAEIHQKLMLELDINKKRAYADYMEKVGNLNQELIQKSNGMERELRNILREEIGQIYDEKNAWIKKLDDLNLSNEDRAEEMGRMEDWIDLAKGQVDGKVQTLVETHSTSLKVTLELLRDEAIRAEDAINLG